MRAGAVAVRAAAAREMTLLCRQIGEGTYSCSLCSWLVAGLPPPGPRLTTPAECRHPGGGPPTSAR
jgi:hypothetical protein